MRSQNLIRLLCSGPVIPAVRSIADYRYALETTSPSIILLFGNLIVLGEILAEAQTHKKRLLVHLDLLDGIGKDKAGIKFLARLGVTGLITTKAYLCKAARDAGMIIVQRLFLMDSEALKTGIDLVKKFKPDAVEVLPASVPASAVAELVKETGLPVMAGGLIYTDDDVKSAINNGLCAVSTSRRDLWSYVD